MGEMSIIDKKLPRVHYWGAGVTAAIAVFNNCAVWIFYKKQVCAFCSYTSQLPPPTNDGKATKHKLQFLSDDGMIGDFYFLLYAFLHLNIFLKWAWTQVTFSCKEQKTLPQAGLHSADIDKYTWSLTEREPQARGKFTKDLLCSLHLSSLWPAPLPYPLCLIKGCLPSRAQRSCHSPRNQSGHSSVQTQKWAHFVSVSPFQNAEALPKTPDRLPWGLIGQNWVTSPPLTQSLGEGLP